MPEMKGRSLEELDEIFEAGLPARKFPQYQCRIHEDAMQDVDAHVIEKARPETLLTECVVKEV
jgi:hypothetical protein